MVRVDTYPNPNPSPNHNPNPYLGFCEGHPTPESGTTLEFNFGHRVAVEALKP